MAFLDKVNQEAVGPDKVEQAAVSLDKVGQAAAGLDKVEKDIKRGSACGVWGHILDVGQLM